MLIDRLASPRPTRSVQDASPDSPLPIARSGRRVPSRSGVGSLRGLGLALAFALTPALTPALVLAAFGAPAEAAEDAPAGPVVEIGEKGFVVHSADDRYMFRIGGRVQVDGTKHFGDVQGAQAAGYGDAPIDGSELRRARIETKARVAEDFIFAGEVGFANNEVGLKDFWVGWEGLDCLTITVGNQKQPYSLQVEESSNDITFVERGIDNYLVIPFVDRAIGARFESSGSHWFVATGVYGESVAPSNTDDEGWGVAGRGIFSPIVEDDRVVHLGFRTAYRQPNRSDHSVRIRDETTNMSDLRIVDTFDVPSIRDVTLYGPEAGFVYRFAYLRGEYNRAHFRRLDGQQDLDFQSGYVALSLVLTGESWAEAYKMSAGEFKRLRPNDPFDPRKNQWGAVELAGRYAYIDLDSGDVTGGQEHAFSTALNWVLNYNVRLMANWTRILKTDDSSQIRRTAQGLNVLTVRAHFMF